MKLSTENHFSVCYIDIFTGAPYVPPASSQPSQPLPPSFQEVKPASAWNDPPLVKDKKKVNIPMTQPAI